jgi:hypothetical protein
MADFNPWEGPAFAATPNVTLSGTVTVAGSAAAGSAPVNPPLSISGVDGSGNKQHLKTDASGVLQAALNDALTFSGSIGAAGVITYSSPGPSSGVIDTAGYAAVVVQLTGTWVGTVTFQESNDNSNWGSVTGGTAGGGISSTASSNVVFRFFSGARYVRVNVTSYTSGTVTAAVTLRAAVPAFANVNVVQGNGTSTATWGAVLNGRTSGGLTKSRIQSAATTNATSAKASAGQVYLVSVGNNGASDAWLKLYDKASSPTVGTDTPVWSAYVPKGTAREVTTDIGLVFSSGIAYAITGGAADTDTTAVAANQVTGVIGYT